MEMTKKWIARLEFHRKIELKKGNEKCKNEWNAISKYQHTYKNSSTCE